MLVVASILVFITYHALSKGDSQFGPDPGKITALVLGDLIIFLIVGILLTYKFFQNAITDKNTQKQHLQNRIIIAFSLVAAVPTIIVSVFSAYFFNFGIQSWFDQKISTILDQSIIVAESYIDEHTIQLKQTAIATADDLAELYYKLIHEPGAFTEALRAEAEMRSLDEALIFQKSTNTILAQTSLSFFLSFAIIPSHLIERADRGEIVQIKTDPTKIRMLVRIKEHDDIYLLIGRLIDRKIIEHVDKTNGAAAEYYRLKKQISSIQVKFSIVFICIALLLLLAAISWGIVFTSQIVKPIRRLVEATQKVRQGDLTVQVPDDGCNKDEIGVLSANFNRMIRQIERQQKELIVAQRALVWSDVARRVAHEIKNPLTPIHLAAERLIRKFSAEVSDQEAFSKYTQTIIRHTEDIRKIVSEFVSFARLPTPNFANCELVSLIKEIVEARKLINDKINYAFSSNTPRLDFIGDVTQINQVMINLLKNAEESLESFKEKVKQGKLLSLDNPSLTHFPIESVVKEQEPKKFSTSEFGLKIEVNINLSSKQTSSDSKEDIVIIKVTDNGPGFSPDIIEKATEAYVTTRAKGTGLGLAIVKKIVQEHAGVIEIANSPNGGAVIKLILNLSELRLKLKT